MKNRTKNFQTEPLDLTKIADSIKSLDIKDSPKEKSSNRLRALFRVDVVRRRDL